MVVALGPGKFYGSSLPRPRIYTDVKFNDERVDPPIPVLDPFMSWAEEAHWSMGGLRLKRHRLQGRIEGSVKKLRAERERFLKKRNQSVVTAMDRISNSTHNSHNKNVSPSPPPAPMVTKRRRLIAFIDDDEDELNEIDHELERGDKRNNGDDNEGVGVRRVKRKSARKLKDDFDRVASQSGLGKSRGNPGRNLKGGSETVASRTRSRGSEKENGDRSNVVKMKSNGKAKSVSKDAASTPVTGTNGKAKSLSEDFVSTPVAGTRTSPRLAKRGSS